MNFFLLKVQKPSLFCVYKGNYGYPMALSGMGNSLKITNGIINSNTGFNNTPYTYQISAPIQAGNSGGPLFDEIGNLVGINSSGINKSIADNVGYAIKSHYVHEFLIKTGNGLFFFGSAWESDRSVFDLNISLSDNHKLKSLKLTEQYKELEKYVVLIKVK